MAHYGIIGMTESGKSTLAKILARDLRSGSDPVKVAVLDPLRYSDWPCDFQTSDPQKFLRFAMTEKSHVLVIDEGGQSVGRYNKEMEWLFTNSRHLGHSIIGVTQGVTQLPPIARGQYSKVYVFNCAFDNFELIANEWNKKALLKLPELGQGEFYRVPRFGKLGKGAIDFKRRKMIDFGLI